MECAVKKIVYIFVSLTVLMILNAGEYAPKKKLSEFIGIDFSIANKNYFDYIFVKNNTVNSENKFDISCYYYRLFTDVKAGINFGSLVRVYIDDSFRFIHEGNEIYNLQSGNHKDKYFNYLENTVKELYIIIKIPLVIPVTVTAGRAYYNFSDSYVFNIFNAAAYRKKVINSILDDDNIGINMLKISFYFPSASIDIVYSPGIHKKSDTTEMFNIPQEQRFSAKADFRFDRVDLNLNAYADSSLNFSFGAKLSCTVYSDMILYFEVLCDVRDRYFRLKEDGVLFGGMHKYRRIEYERPGFKGVAGMNLTPGSFLNVIAEIYFNSNGLNPGEQKLFFEYLSKINDNHYDPETVDIPAGASDPVKDELRSVKKEQKKGYSSYYYGLLGNAMKKYDPFEIGMFFLFIRINKEDICSTGIDLELSSFIYLLDFSVMLMPKFSYNFFKFFKLEISSSIYIGCKGSIFGEMPYTADIKIMFEIKI